MKTLATWVGGVVLILLSTTLMAKQAAVSLTPDEAVFQSMCLRHTKTCLYEKMHFLAKDHVITTSHAYYLLPNKASVDAFNRLAKGYTSNAIAHHGVTDVTEAVDVLAASGGTWVAAKGRSDCPFCVDLDPSPDNAFWIRVIQKIGAVAADNAFIAKDFSVGHGEQFFVKVLASAEKGVPLYSEARANGVHISSLPISKDGAIEIILNSDWAKFPMPDYISVSPVKSWRDVASTYRDREREILGKPNALPTFDGSDDFQKIDKIVAFVNAMKWNPRPVMDGWFPYQSVHDIVQSKSTDCKGFTTLLQALLQKSGIASHPVALEINGAPPVSFDVPSHWADHVILYVPIIDTYIDEVMV